MKVLFLFHEAHLTGATLTLFNSVKWYSENTDISMSFLLKGDGVLKEEIAQIGPVYQWDLQNRSRRSIFERFLNLFLRPKSYQERLLEFLYLQKFDIIYANTILSSDLITKMARFNSRIIWHIHELELAIGCLGEQHLEANKDVHYIIANSKSTMNNLVRIGISAAKISVQYPFISIKNILNSESSVLIRESLNIPNDAFVIGTSGTVIERKGIQSFIQLPLIVDYFFPANNFYYVWVGETFNNKIIEYDIVKAGIKNKVIFTGEKRNPYPYFNIFDVFVSCSKEESFGLCSLEAGALHKPLICFKNTGGIEEIVSKAGNISVPYLDIIELAKKIIEISCDNNLKIKLGNLAYNTAMEYDIELIMPKLYDYIKNVHAKNI